MMPLSPLRLRKKLKTAELCLEAVKNLFEGTLENVLEGLRGEVRSMLVSSLSTTQKVADC